MKPVYIPTRGRLPNVDKLLRSWLIHMDGFQVTLVVEPDEVDLHNSVIDLTLGPDARRNGEARVLALPEANRGIGYSRNFILRDAEKRAHTSILLSDDDIRPTSTARSYKDMLDFAENDKVLGITTRYSYHDFVLGPKIKYRNDIVLLSSGTFRMIALNVNNVIALGNYDERLTCVQEDGDLMLRGIKAGIPWMINLGAHAVSMGARYAEGGISDLMKGDNRKNMERECHNILYSKHQGYVNAPTSVKETSRGNGVRVRWKKALDDNLPMWESYSDLDGGSLEAYLNG